MTRTKTKPGSKGTRRICGCGNGCLGPLTFNTETKGKLVTVSEGDRRATREISSFRYGLVFSSRPLKIEEKVCLRVERSVLGWHGALRIGFTSVAPGSRTLPPLAIPDLTSSKGYWAVPVPEHQCLPRSELKFWVCRAGCLCIQAGDGHTHVTRIRVNTSKPIWAMIDIYGQTNAVLLIGSEKKGWFSTRRSCPVLAVDATDENCGYDMVPAEMTSQRSSEKQSQTFPLCQRNGQHTNGQQTEDCVVCCSAPAGVLLTCGHRCLCTPCAFRVLSEFGTCPLCRHCIRPDH